MDPITAGLLLATELTKAWQLWFAAQTVEVQQAGGNVGLEVLTQVKALVQAAQGLTPPATIKVGVTEWTFQDIVRLVQALEQRQRRRGPGKCLDPESERLIAMFDRNAAQLGEA